MKYVSTRGAAPVLPFDEVLLAGLAADGGLYVPESWPSLPAGRLESLAGRPYADVAVELMAPFVADAVDGEVLHRVVADAYAGFRHAAVAPLRQIGDNEWLLELFHGPTLAFKDLALQVVGRLFDHVLARRGERLTIVGATSGDTGSAAIEACRDRDALDVFILHPAGRVSEVQRRQMTTVDATNVHNLAVEGTFDDCQSLVKALFGDAPFRDRYRLSAVNSINWARILPQTVYYVTAAVALGAPARPVAFSVPTGNFGNVFAGWVARRMGLPVDQLVVASNRNDTLTRFLRSGRLEVRQVVATTSPSMDIQVSSNVERLLFEALDRDGAAVAALMDRFGRERRLQLGATAMAGIRAVFDGAEAHDDAVAQAMAQVHDQAGALIDPHTGVGVVAARACRRDPAVPMVVLATAHPAKLPEAVAAATGVVPSPPEHLADLLERPERVVRVPNDLAAVRGHIAAHARA
ncbi:MAG: threonine synthase [Acidimicrobiales bacterium]